jgi:peptide/nickel transport system permease protein
MSNLVERAALTTYATTDRLQAAGPGLCLRRYDVSAFPRRRAPVARERTESFMVVGPTGSVSDQVPVGREPEEAKPVAGEPIQGRSLGRIAWTRFKRDKLAVAGGIVVILLILMAIFAPLITKVWGYNPAAAHPEMIDQTYQKPFATFPFGGFNSKFLMGVNMPFGNDIFSQVVYGARISLVIAFLATMLCVFIGATLGLIAGYYGGFVDTVISRAMDVFLAFPILIFAISIAGVVPDTGFGLKGNSLRIVLLIFVIGFFNWAYIARIVRGQVLSLREREFVDAARSLGARNGYIIVREILPNLIAPILVYTTLLIPSNILFEAALSFLGVGVKPPAASWGAMLSEGAGYFTLPHMMFWPGMAIFITVLAFNLFGDGLRDALDPKSR